VLLQFTIWQQVLSYNDEVGCLAMRLDVSKCRCLKGSSTPAYKGAWHGHHDGTGVDTIWSPRLSPTRVLQGNPPWACLRIRHKLPRPVSAMGFPATGPPGRQSVIPPPWATLACWFRTTSLVYPFGISPTLRFQGRGYGRLRIRRLQTETGGTMFTQVQAPGG
jgi:hypothetical protein